MADDNTTLGPHGLRFIEELKLQLTEAEARLAALTKERDEYAAIAREAMEMAALSDDAYQSLVGDKTPEALRDRLAKIEAVEATPTPQESNDGT